MSWCLSVNSQNFRKHCCNVTFPCIQQQLLDKMLDDLKYGHQQAIIGMQRELRIAETDHDNRIQAIK